MENLQKQTISACMIVKNEQEFLPTCLTSIKNAVDEIIVVDTGSTDKTVPIAKDFGAKVYYHPWNDSFSEARNHSLRYATGDWILQIDADEELDQSDVHKLRHIINTSNYNGILVAIYSIIKGDVHKFYNTRIFRRNDAFYKDIIHEQIVIEGKRLPTEIRLYHHGYNLDEEKMRVKWQRTTYLLKKQITQDTSNSFAWFNLIRNYRSQGLFFDGIHAGKEALKIIIPDAGSEHTEANVNIHVYAMIIYETANCYLHTENFIKAKELCYNGLSTLSRLGTTPENVDIVFTLACIYLKEGNYAKAIEYFKRFLSLREQYLKNLNTVPLMVDTLGYDSAAYNGLGFCFGNLGEWQKAIDYLKKAIDSNPKYLPAYKNLALSYSSTGNNADAINTLLCAISEGIGDDIISLKLGELYIKQKAYEKAIPHLEEYVKKHPDDKSVLINVAWCYEELGCMEAAIVGYTSAGIIKESNNNQYNVSWEAIFCHWPIMHAWAKKGRLIPPPPNKEKEKIIKDYAKQFSIDVLIETGTFVGSMIYAVKNSFKEIFSIELDHNFFELNKIFFANDPHIHIIEGDSGNILPKLLETIRRACLFWLDGHYSGKGTAKGKLETPIMQELQGIFAHTISDHVILIDDAKDFTGSNNYPTIEELRNFVSQNRPGWTFEIKNDIMRIHKNMDKAFIRI